MRWLWILPAVLLLLLILLCLTRVGIQASYDSGGFRLKIRAGWLHFKVFPLKAPKKRQKKKHSKAKPVSSAPKTEKKRTLPPITLQDIRDVVSTLLPPLRKALRRTRRGIRISPLQLSLTLAGQENPAAAAELYGRLQVLLWTGMPAAQQLLNLPDPRIHIEVDFNASSLDVEGELGISARIGTLLAIGLGVGIPAAGWLLRFLKKRKPKANAALKAEPLN